MASAQSIFWWSIFTRSKRRWTKAPAKKTASRTRSEEHTSELQAHRDLHSFPTRRSSDLMKDHGIGPIDLLVVNLYPFEATVDKGASEEDCIENIDIGGPAMIRAAAKNHDDGPVVGEA